MAALVLLVVLLSVSWVRSSVERSSDLFCSLAPGFEPGSTRSLWEELGSSVELYCTAELLWEEEAQKEAQTEVQKEAEAHCNTTLRWSKDDLLLTNYTQNSSSWSPGPGRLVLSSGLLVSLRTLEDFGVYSCSVGNSSAHFLLRSSDVPSHTAAVVAALVLLLVLSGAALIFSRCQLDLRLWYKNHYGELELNDGKLFDAYISYVNNDHDRKFVNFILKPHLENKQAFKLHLNDNDVLPGSEPSAELLRNLSRSRRLIVLLSHAYLEQDWCCSSFRRGLLHLLDLSPQLILVLLEGQLRHMRTEVKQQLSEQQHRLSILTWRHDSVTPSSSFWKELSLAMPRRVLQRGLLAADPQTLLHEDKDPMLTLEPELDQVLDPDPAGDLGLRLPVYRALACTAPVLPADLRPADLDVSDLGSRSYAARSDFYCLVSEDV